MADFRNEIEKRRTFAIISHPDAGKTTLTEKFLLYGGAIQLAGAVKGKKNARHAVSDWMEIEKQRGISVTSSVMQFQYEGYCINILDTPGHQDFSEDTYRTLMAADSAVMVIDASKGVEAQTRKLFKVCVMRDIPIFTFINKMDRDAQSPYDLLDEIEKELGIGTYPMNWPIGSGVDFKGVYDREKSEILAFEGDKELRGQHEVKAHEIDLNDAALETILGESLCQTLRDDVELLDGAGYEFDLEKVRHGKLSPVFFGSALTNFGVEPFLESFLRMTTSPLPRQTSEGVVDPFSKDFSAFVFKIQANMNKAHRDRIAFMRICSGKFEKGMEVTHVQGGRKIKLSQPQQMMAQSREIIDEAYAGDIIGVFDPGIFSIGDTITVPGKKFKYSGIPVFAPEHFSRVSAKDSMKRKQFVKGTEQIAQEGAIQIFKVPNSGMEEVIVGVVGTLQFDVFEYRMKNEYGVDLRMEGLPYEEIRLIDKYPGDLSDLNLGSDAELLEDYRGRNLLVFTSFWAIDFTCRRNPGLELSEIVVSEG
ncbi:peptide chain release factor 3 [Hominenteromicrobium sp.]|uniref:peptide chain release factor 3 n=3 Tax=Hominenteromicrobium sp. TaxID=3073581 RepID=UPI003AEFF7ED